LFISFRGLTELEHMLTRFNSVSYWAVRSKSIIC